MRINDTPARPGALLNAKIVRSLALDDCDNDVDDDVDRTVWQVSTGLPTTRRRRDAAPPTATAEKIVEALATTAIFRRHKLVVKQLLVAQECAIKRHRENITQYFCEKHAFILNTLYLFRENV